MESPISVRFDVFRQMPSGIEVWGREGFQVEAATAEEAAQKVADALPDHLLQRPLIVLPSDAVETFIPAVQNAHSRTVSVAVAEPADFTEHKGWRFPTWYKRKDRVA